MEFAPVPFTTRSCVLLNANAFVCCQTKVAVITHQCDILAPSVTAYMSVIGPSAGGASSSGTA
jgi:hypothetical protein